MTSNTSKSQILPPFPPAIDFETPDILKAVAVASRWLGELKGTARSLPNQGILLDTLSLQEALASSEIENIVTTQDEVFQIDPVQDVGSPEAKEVARYAQAMRHGFAMWQKKQFINENMLIEMFRILKHRNDGYRTNSGTVLRDGRGQTIYTPPQNTQDIVRLMRDLEAFINEYPDDLDPLIRMAIIHHQFESIHPFPDGNGRVGRMLNVLYLTHTDLLDVPILYLSRAINASKEDYYRLLQAVRDEGAWQEWIIYILDAVAQTAISTLRLIEEIRGLMQDTKQRLRNALPKIYSQDLLNNLFRYPYTRIEYLMADLKKTRPTVTQYLETLAKNGFLEKMKSGRNNYYINAPLVALLFNVSEEYMPQAAMSDK